jgi:prephenate dehydrogenase
VQNKKQIEISIIGAGRFGLFWGTHLNTYHPVYFFDTDERRHEQIHDITGNHIASWESLEVCLRKDYIFLTIPIGRMATFLQENAFRIKAGSVLIDCASVKEPVLNWFAKYLPKEIYYAASHPLFGPDSARDGLEGHIITLIPGRIPYTNYQLLVRLFSDRMKLMVLNLTAQEHDKLMAYNLSLVHHLGRTFHKMRIFKLPLMMSGLKNLNHISQIVMNDSQELFEDFYRYNAYSEEVKEKFLEHFRELTATIK